MSNPSVEIFMEHMLLSDVIDYVLQPYYEQLSAVEKTEFLEAYKVTEIQIPKIYVTDPVAKYFNMKIGDVIRIKRSNELAGINVAYRIAI